MSTLSPPHSSNNFLGALVTLPSPQQEVGEARTLLVVDDEPAIRELVAQVLCHEGYKVLQAGGAAEALRLATAATIHLLLTDFSMPEADGLELIRRFRSVYPKAPVLILSGSLACLDGRAGEMDRLAMLEKPFAVDELVSKVRALLTEVSPLPIREARRPINQS
jgi:DNA-binding response OmpR family regulator